ncbi:hypothetical protein [Mesorhizobium sp. INR15]|uniref:hypothetical protein n=1 Tax=Mesorhizobium sp. INR15 TaxID=2654248 RepID=UPI00189672E9|nr:hypothetical protein [Mesorhizobium sp. INR15]
MTDPKTGKPVTDEQAIRLAEQTDVSPKQAKELIEQHGEAEAKKKAKNYKAEG